MQVSALRLSQGPVGTYYEPVTYIAATHAVVGPYGYPQEEIIEAFTAVVSPEGAHQKVIERIHLATGVKHRNLAIPLEDYSQLTDFGVANDEFIRVGLELGVAAISGALSAANIDASEVDMIMSTSVTGIAAPSLEARLVPMLGMREDVKRIPIFGLGCVAGAAGIARVHDYLVWEDPISRSRLFESF